MSTGTELPFEKSQSAFEAEAGCVGSKNGHRELDIFKARTFFATLLLTLACLMSWTIDSMDTISCLLSDAICTGINLLNSASCGCTEKRHVESHLLFAVI